MNAQEAVRQQLEFWHRLAGEIVAGSGDALNKRVPGANVGSIASIWVHAVHAEDAIVNGFFRGKPTLFETNGFQAKTGIEPPDGTQMTLEWAARVNLDLASFAEYSSAVFAQTDAYVANASVAEMQGTFPTPAGDQPIGWTMVNILPTHFISHVGEIAALKGVHGLQGLTV